MISFIINPLQKIEETTHECNPRNDFVLFVIAEEPVEPMELKGS